MFLKINEFKKAMKSALKTSGGLIIGNVKGHFLVHTSLWGVWVESVYATSKFKAAIAGNFDHEHAGLRDSVIGII